MALKDIADIADIAHPINKKCRVIKCIKPLFLIIKKCLIYCICGLTANSTLSRYKNHVSKFQKFSY